MPVISVTMNNPQTQSFIPVDSGERGGLRQPPLLKPPIEQPDSNVNNTFITIALIGVALTVLFLFK